MPLPTRTHTDSLHRDDATVDQLRDDISSGKTGDKVSFNDPAAAPLGTDDEAGGHPPGGEAVALARRQERAPERAPSTRADGEQGRPPGGFAPGLGWRTMGMIAVCALFLLLVVFAALRLA